ncbi:hypothetical protein [Mucilaginibacter flavidus]|uniref:hypothetical protein n=1 Tax=Mucilaginibacter flavidus TaxID=2949309 RepID=UPI002092029D|nr:hypothetical protein [Mucilaginibacter flavidus]MCO5949911.1 hypothetical protein [Mucilaginibacter flavidus]
MKRIKQLFFACLTVGLFTFQSPAKADGHSGPADDSKTSNKTSSNNNTGTAPPVNNNIAFLIVVGVAIGGKIISDKIKSVRQ